MKKQEKMWQVKLQPPMREAQYVKVSAVDNMTAKCKASMYFYNHVFTGQFRFMRASVVK